MQVGRQRLRRAKQADDRDRQYSKRLPRQRQLTIRAASMRGSLTSLQATCHAVEREAKQVTSRFVPEIADAIVADLVVTRARLPADYARHLPEFRPSVRYERNPIDTTVALLKQVSALNQHAGRSERTSDRAKLVFGASPPGGQIT